VIENWYHDLIRGKDGNVIDVPCQITGSSILRVGAVLVRWEAPSPFDDGIPAVHR
jgi:hypothetical protein